LLWPGWRWMTIGGTPSRAHLDGMGVPELMRCKTAEVAATNAAPAGRPER
jgi:hypothetical protein